MSGSGKLYWSKFVWGDWENDPALRLCSFSAQGLWMRMLCVAAKHDPIGYVAVAGKGLDIPGLARVVGGNESEINTLLGELDRNGVFSRDRHQRIYCRRMVRDARKAAIARKNGQKGGNPSLRDTERIPSSVNHKSNPRSSLLASGSDPSQPTLGLGEGGAARASGWPDDAFEQFYGLYPHKVGKKAARRAFDTAKRSSITFQQLMAGLKRYIAEKPPDRAWCNPATWLNGGRWDDEPAAISNGNGGNGHHRQTGSDTHGLNASALAVRRFRARFDRESAETG